MTDQPPPAAPAGPLAEPPPGRPGMPRVQLVTSRGFHEWLAGERLSLALTTYHAGALILLGRKPVEDVSIHLSAWDRAMGMWTDGQSLWLASSVALWRLENCLTPGLNHDGYDRVFVPRVGHVTGDLDIHDVALDADRRPVFVNARFSCLATVDERYNFAPLWQPPFITALHPEDRCHLNGLAMEAGRPKYVTCHARSDVADGWRDFRTAGGLVLEVPSGAVVAEGLSMPHSPRLHDGRLWLLNSGTGYLGFIDRATGRFEPVTFLPGYARGLAFHGKYAVVGLSKPRREHAFQGLPLERELAQKGAAPRCGFHVIEVATGATLHTARIESAIEELYDVAVLPGVVRPRALSAASTSVGHHFCFANQGQVNYWSSSPSPVKPGR